MSVNDITGDRIVTDIPSEKFKNGWDAIWAKKVEPDTLKAYSCESESEGSGLCRKHCGNEDSCPSSNLDLAEKGVVFMKDIIQLVVDRNDSVPEERQKWTGYAS